MAATNMSTTGGMETSRPIPESWLDTIIAFLSQDIYIPSVGIMPIGLLLHAVALILQFVHSAISVVNSREDKEEKKKHEEDRKQWQRDRKRLQEAEQVISLVAEKHGKESILDAERQVDILQIKSSPFV